MFSVSHGSPRGALVSTTLLGRRYSITADADRVRNMQVISIIQQLVNLHKSATERPVTVPVRVLPG